MGVRRGKTDKTLHTGIRKKKWVLLDLRKLNVSDVPSDLDRINGLASPNQSNELLINISKFEPV